MDHVRPRGRRCARSTWACTARRPSATASCMPGGAVKVPQVAGAVTATLAECSAGRRLRSVRSGGDLREVCRRHQKPVLSAHANPPWLSSSRIDGKQCAGSAQHAHATVLTQRFCSRLPQSRAGSRCRADRPEARRSRCPNTSPVQYETHLTHRAESQSDQHEHRLCHARFV